MLLAGQSWIRTYLWRGYESTIDADVAGTALLADCGALAQSTAAQNRRDDRAG